MKMLLIMCLFKFIVVDCVFSEWVEIPQLSNKKTYFPVTPYSPYVYTPSLIFTSTTTESYDTMAPPLPKPKHTNTKNDQKKSITKMPDAVLRKTTTEPPPRLKPTPGSSRKPSANKHNQRIHGSNQNNNNPYQTNTGANKKAAPPTSTTPISILPPAKISNKNFQIQNEEEEFEDGVAIDGDEDDDEYEVVYDDDEDGDGYDPESDDIDDATGTSERPPDGGDDDEYYDDDEEYEDEPEVDEAKGNTHQQKGSNNAHPYTSFLPYLKNIQSTLIRNSHTHTNSVNSKVSFLTDIKDRLLYAIQSRISSIWQTRHKRQTRATRGDMWDSWEKGHSEHGMEFPSNEGALLTLGFLTFAVFLIKCILKLIHAIKGKHHDKGHMNHPIIITNGTSVISAINGLNGFNGLNGGTTFRLKRDIDEVDIANFMHNLDNYKPH